MAEAILRDRLGAVQGWTVASAGVLAKQDEPASPEAVIALHEAGMDLSGHRSQPLTRELVDASTIIVVMTGQHLVEVLRCFPEAKSRVFMMTSFGTKDTPVDIPDPFGQSLEVYRWTRDQIASTTADVILHIMDH